LQAGRARHVFLLWARPIAALLALVAYGAVELVRPSSTVDRELAIVGVSLAAAGLYVLAARRFDDESVLRVALPLDTLLIAALTLAVGRPELVAVAFFWSIALASFLLGPRETLANTAVAVAGAAAVPYLSSRAIDEVVHVTDVLVLGLIGCVLALLSAQSEHATGQLAREQAVDAAALRIAERIRSSLDLRDVIESTVAEIGQATRSARALLRMASPIGHLYQWTRHDTAPVVIAAPTPAVLRVVGTGVPLVVESREEAPPDAEFLAYLERFDVHALIAYPVFLGDEVVAVIGAHDTRPRSWSDAVLLLERIVPQIGAAIVQAEAYERLRELTRLREDLVANVSHELRTPLTSTLGFLQTLERADLELGPEQRAALLGIARREAQRLARLVDDLLELTRFERGAMTLRIAPVSLAELVEQAAAAHPDADGRLADLHLDVRIVVPADADRLAQVLTNLLGNALRHGTGAVAVHAVAEDDAVRLEISDEGAGLGDADPESIFLPFARGSSPADGTGLGLAISRRIVEAHGGRLTYRPRSEDEPHAFVVELPRHPPVAAHRLR
jgi:signal transduction histidine kinase